MSAAPRSREEVGEAAGRVLETGQRILSKRIELLRGEFVAAMRGASLALCGVALAMLGIGWLTYALFLGLTQYLSPAVAAAWVAGVALTGASGAGLVARRALPSGSEVRR